MSDKLINHIMKVLDKIISFVLAFLILSLMGTFRLDAQDYAKWFGVWDPYRGSWYGNDDTRVRLSREDGDEMFVNIFYNGVEYQDALWCVSSSLATASNLSSVGGNTSTSLSADICLSNGKLVLKMYSNNSTTPFYTTPLNKTRNSNQSTSPKKNPDNNTAGMVTSLRAEIVARQFCEAMYDNNMARAKAMMTADDARRTPDTIRESPDVLATYKRRLQSAKYKVIESEYSSSIVTVRFYDPSFPYLDKRGRWFGCAVGLVKVNGQWKVTDYGY